MDRHILFAPLLLLACRAKEPPPRQTAIASHSRPAVALMGDWIQQTPLRYRGDTLRLRGDSSAKGRVPGETPQRDATRWKILFTSREAPTSRTDWWGGYQDGGDLDCQTGESKSCVSAPTFCVGDRTGYSCVGFRFRLDTLTLSSGDVFIRAAASHDSTTSASRPGRS